MTNAGGDPNIGGTSDADLALGRRVGVGCFATFIGMVTGGMVGVLLGRVVEWLRKAPTCTGVPICNWTTYWLAGAILGAVTLPTLVLMRMRRR